MTLNSEAEEYFRTDPDDHDYEADEEFQDKIRQFEDQHLSERERKLIHSSIQEQ